MDINAEATTATSGTAMQSRMLSTIVSVNAMLRSRCDFCRRRNFCGADPWPKMSAAIPPEIRAADSCTESHVGSAWRDVVST